MTAPGADAVSAARAAHFDAAAIGGDIQRRLGIRTVRDEPLAGHTTMRVGGPADLLATVHNAFELRALVRFARTRGIPHVVLGRGSDLVVSDAGIRGLTILCRAEGYEVRGERLMAEAGLPMAKAATVTQKAGLSGLEFGLAIPGTVGGAVWANAGAHESDVAGVLETALVLLGDGTEATLGPADLGLTYRDSRLKHLAPDTPPDLVISATFHLVPAEPATIRGRLDDIRAWRRAHQPIGMPSAGSVFRNPPGDSAGRLIDQAGLKGRRVGGAVVSEKHANFIVNDGGATAADVRGLAELVRAEVERRFGVALVFEVQFAGDWSRWRAEGEPDGGAQEGSEQPR